METNNLTPKEQRRFHRQMLVQEIGQVGQLALKMASVLVVGAGGLGASVLQNLAAVGIGRIGIIDFSVVDEDSLMRQCLYGDNDMGKLKAIISREKLQQYSPLTEYEVINTRLTRDNILSFLDGFQWVVDATNKEEMHFLINDACILQAKPLVFGYTSGCGGTFALLNHHGGPSLRCQFPDVSAFRRHTEGKTAGIIAIACQITGALMAWELLQALIYPEKTTSSRLVTIELPGHTLSSTPILRQEKNFAMKELGSDY